MTPELRKFLDAHRVRILQGSNGHGMGRRSHENVLQMYKVDVNAVADFLGSKPYFLGDEPHNVDAVAYAMLRHLTDQPQKWAGTGYVESKANVIAYLGRMRNRFDM